MDTIICNLCKGIGKENITVDCFRCNGHGQLGFGEQGVFKLPSDYGMKKDSENQKKINRAVMEAERKE